MSTPDPKDAAYDLWLRQNAALCDLLSNGGTRPQPQPSTRYREIQEEQYRTIHDLKR